MQTPDEAASLLTLIGYSKGSRCGISYYCGAKYLTVEHYQILLDRGWRRSGTTLYKPNLLASCCAQYTVRLDSAEFHSTKDQRQCINRLNKHILGEPYIKTAARIYPLSRDQAKRRDTDFDLVSRVHESEKSHLPTINSKPAQTLEPAHNFVVTLESNEYTEEKYAIFENYQRIVHHEKPEDISKRGFKGFLCTSPLPNSLSPHGKRYGSYHQCYRIDGVLVAIGVLDLLPHCVSGVYFLYHESVHQYSFGKVGALREIALAKEEGYRYWYAGFYIHSCKKMKYKGDFSPQSILDPESNTWEPLDEEMKAKLDKQKYISLSRERSGIAYSAAAFHRVPSPKTAESINAQAHGKDDVTEEAEILETDIDNDGDGEDDEDSSDMDDTSAPLFESGMPGVLTKQELLDQVDLDSIRIRIRKADYVTSDLMSWDAEDIDEPGGLKAIFGGLAAALGPEMIKEVIVCLG